MECMNSVTACNEEDHKELVHKQENGFQILRYQFHYSTFFFSRYKALIKSIPFIFMINKRGKYHRMYKN